MSGMVRDCPAFVAVFLCAVFRWGCVPTCPAGSSVCSGDMWTCKAGEGGCESQQRKLIDLKYGLLSEEERDHQRSLHDSLLLACPNNNSSAPVTCEECCNGIARRILKDAKKVEKDKEAPMLTPWMHPHVKKTAQAELVEEDPGIWIISNFFDDKVIDDLTDAVIRAGDDMEQFGRCAGVSHEHLEDKECFRLSKTTSHEDDADLVEHVMEEIATLWPSQEEQRDYFYTQRTKPGCGLTEVHRDVNHHDLSSATTTTVLYLSDGGAGVFFPHTNTVITPKRGMMVTWINTKPCGAHNDKSNHGIQATPMDMDVDRLALTFRIHMSMEERKKAKEAAEAMARRKTEL